jgi:MYXO-CTERM domain-containing protein
MGRLSSRARVRPVWLAAALTLGACGPELEAPTAEQQSPILGGTADTTDGAVMALVHQTSASMSNLCTGTVIAKSGASGILLTAAHCVVVTNGRTVTVPIKAAPASQLFVVPGNDWQVSLRQSQYFDVAAAAVHPSYDGMVNSAFDVALVRFVGATAATPTIPALAPAEDTMNVGSAFTLVGYGETETNKNNSVRRQVARTIESLTDHQFLYDQKDLKGACEGDSGGPALFQTPGGARVGGVTSFGDIDCTQIGVSVRVAPVSAFIQSFITGAPLKLTCDECTAAAVAPGNTCTSQGATCNDATTPCGQFLGCASTCTTNSCVSACTSKNAAGSAAYDALANCQCTACSTECASSNACNPSAPPPVTAACGGISDQRAACQTCIDKTCCAEALACANDGVCASCLVQSSASCRADTAFSKLRACQATCAGAPCSATAGPADDAGAPTDDAGAPGETGGSGCSCDVGGGASAPLGLGLALAALVARRRRR